MYLNLLVKVPNAPGKLLFQKKAETTYVYYEIGRTCISSSVFPKNRKEKFPTLGMGYSQISAGDIFI